MPPDRPRIDLRTPRLRIAPSLLAADFARSLTAEGTVVLAGLLGTQAKAVTAAYDALGMTLRDGGSGEWPVLVLST